MKTFTTIRYFNAARLLLLCMLAISLFALSACSSMSAAGSQSVDGDSVAVTPCVSSGSTFLGIDLNETHVLSDVRPSVSCIQVVYSNK